MTSKAEAVDKRAKRQNNENEALIKNYRDVVQVDIFKHAQTLSFLQNCHENNCYHTAIFIAV
jgi:hypothetical protein